MESIEFIMDSKTSFCYIGVCYCVLNGCGFIQNAQKYKKMVVQKDEKKEKHKKHLHTKSVRGNIST